MDALVLLLVPVVQFNVNAVTSLFASFNCNDELEAVTASGALFAVGVKSSVFLQPKSKLNATIEHAVKNKFVLKFTNLLFETYDDMRIAIVFKINSPGFV